MDLDYSIEIVTYRGIHGNKNLKIQYFYVNLRGLNRSKNSFSWPLMRSVINIADLMPLIMPPKSKSICYIDAFLRCHAYKGQTISSNAIFIRPPVSNKLNIKVLARIGFKPAIVNTFVSYSTGLWFPATMISLPLYYRNGSVSV